MYTMADHFSKEVLKVSIAKIGHHFGVDQAEEHAFDTLVDVIGKYIETFGLLTNAFAEHDGRTKANLMDLMQTFEALQPNGVNWKSLIEMTDMEKWDISFPTGIPDYPVDAKRHRKMKMYGDQTSTSEDMLPPDIPAFLPRFPAEHTYKVTPVNATTPIEDPKEIVQKTVEGKILVQNALSKIRKTEMEPKPAPFGDGNVSGDNAAKISKPSSSQERQVETTANVTAQFEAPKPADAFL